MSKFIFLLFLSDFIVPSLCRYKIGDPCNENNVTGVCKDLEQCSYAIKLISVDKVAAPTCTYIKSKEISCCPPGDSLYMTGVFKDYFSHLRGGILASNNMTCRYDGYEPLLCCGAETMHIQPETGCPPLPRPKLNTPDTHIAWSKCLDYQRYFNVCLPDGSRENTCIIANEVTRIAYGKNADLQQFPHMAVIGCRNARQNDTDIIWVGGGSLISEKFILTATHVLSEPEHGLVTYALLGALNKTDLSQGFLYNIIRIIPHPLYQTGYLLHDIALLELDRPVALSQFIRPACLPVPGLMVQDYYIIAGWGATAKNMVGSDLLQTGLASADTRCSTNIKHRNFSWSDEHLICAKGMTSHPYPSDTCRGDSGGPLMSLIKNIECSYSIEGVVSFGPTCGVNKPALYTRVSFYLDWIVQKVWPK